LPGFRLFFDGGSGLRKATTGAVQESTGGTHGAVLFSHLHWDHIQGLPFAAALYDPSCSFELLGPVGLVAALRRQMTRPSFPVSLQQLRGVRAIRELQPGERLSLGGFEVLTGRLLHPDGALGYRCAAAGRTVVYACDHEHPPDTVDAALVDFARQSDLLVHDAQYLPEELPLRRGWGHSSYASAAETAAAAGVAALILTHHDPGRADAAVAALQRAARQRFPSSWAAVEGARARWPSPQRDPSGDIAWQWPAGHSETMDVAAPGPGSALP